MMNNSLPGEARGISTAPGSLQSQGFHHVLHGRDNSAAPWPLFLWNWAERFTSVPLWSLKLVRKLFWCFLLTELLQEKIHTFIHWPSADNTALRTFCFHPDILISRTVKSCSWVNVYDLMSWGNIIKKSRNRKEQEWNQINRHLPEMQGSKIQWRDMNSTKQSLGYKAGEVLSKQQWTARENQFSALSFKNQY